MELKALDCSGKEEEEELVSGRGRGGECRWLSCSQGALSLRDQKGVEGGAIADALSGGARLSALVDLNSTDARSTGAEVRGGRRVDWQ